MSYHIKILDLKNFEYCKLRSKCVDWSIWISQCYGITSVHIIRKTSVCFDS